MHHYMILSSCPHCLWSPFVLFHLFMLFHASLQSFWGKDQWCGKCKGQTDSTLFWPSLDCEKWVTAELPTVRIGKLIAGKSRFTYCGHSRDRGQASYLDFLMTKRGSSHLCHQCSFQKPAWHLLWQVTGMKESTIVNNNSKIIETLDILSFSFRIVFTPAGSLQMFPVFLWRHTSSRHTWMHSYCQILDRK